MTPAVKSGRLNREQKKARTRARLIDAGAKVLLRRGLAAATLDEIADEARLTKGAVYSNFAGKEELLGAVLDERLSQRMLRIPELIESAGPPDRQAEEAGQLFMQTFEEVRPWFVLDLELSAYGARHPEFRRRGLARQREIKAAIAEEIARRAAENGITLPLPAEYLAQGFWALGSGLAHAKLDDPEAVPDDLFGALLRLINRALMRPPTADA